MNNLLRAGQSRGEVNFQNRVKITLTQFTTVTGLIKFQQLNNNLKLFTQLKVI